MKKRSDGKRAGRPAMPSEAAAVRCWPEGPTSRGEIGRASARGGESECDALLARKGQRVVAIENSFRPLGPAADATRRRSRSLERPADRAGWRTASLQQASKACCPKSKQARHFPRPGENGGLGFRREFLRAQARKIPPSKKRPFAGSSQPATVAALRGYLTGQRRSG